MVAVRRGDVYPYLTKLKIHHSFFTWTVYDHVCCNSIHLFCVVVGSGNIMHTTYFRYSGRWNWLHSCHRCFCDDSILEMFTASNYTKFHVFMKKPPSCDIQHISPGVSHEPFHHNELSSSHQCFVICWSKLVFTCAHTGIVVVDLHDCTTLPKNA